MNEESQKHMGDQEKKIKGQQQQRSALLINFSVFFLVMLSGRIVYDKT
jgi:hypothetical protein